MSEKIVFQTHEFDLRLNQLCYCGCEKQKDNKNLQFEFNFIAELEKDLAFIILKEIEKGEYNGEGDFDYRITIKKIPLKGNPRSLARREEMKQMGLI